MSELEPLSEGARAAIADELRAPSGDPAVRARVAGRLEAALGAAFAVTATASAAGAAAPSAAAKGTVALTHGKLAAIVVAAVAAGAGAGVGVDRALSARSAAPIASVSAPSTATAPAPSAPTATAVPAPSASTEPPPVKPSASTPSVASVPTDSAGDLARERALIDAARAGLKHGNASAALDAVQRHGKSFPNGQLREEREGIRILALASLGRLDEARAHDKKFRAAYPQSLFRPQIDAALGAAP